MGAAGRGEGRQPGQMGTLRGRQLLRRQQAASPRRSPSNGAKPLQCEAQPI